MPDPDPVTPGRSIADPEQAARAPSSIRYHSLDGLRGAAAVVVVIYHALLIVPSVASYYLGESSPIAPSVEWWLIHTPLRLMLAGHEAVLVFFVLSGFVLALPVARARAMGHHFAWRAYYPRRFARLYLPVWGSLLFALALAALVPRDNAAPSGWLASHQAPSARALGFDSVLLFGTSNLNSPLWSLRWEMWFSLLLPLMFVAVRLLASERWWGLSLVLLAGCSASAQLETVRSALPLGWMTAGLLEYIPVFAIGMVLALRVDQLQRVAARILAAPLARTVWFVFAAASLLLALSPSFVAGPRHSLDTLDAVLAFISLLGVIGIIFTAMHAPFAQRGLQRRPFRWAGSRSFSMYLIHEPILVALALLTRSDGWTPWIFIALAALPLIGGVTEVFFRTVERPTLRLSQWLGRRLDPTVPRAPAQALHPSVSAIRHT